MKKASLEFKYKFLTFISCLFILLLLSPSISNATELALIDEYDNKVNVNIDDKTDIVAVASWCPYSKELVGFLKDYRTSKYLSGRTILFVLDNEWPRVQKKLNEAVGNGELTRAQAAQVLADMKEESSGKPVTDVSFLYSLPGDYYFIPAGSNISHDGYPSFYSRASNRFDQNRGEWAVRRLKMPAKLASEIMEKHRPTH
ncbi:MAG: hypothetical protein V3T30_02540 [Thermodesulfobacteriota bacterium]